MAVSKAHCQLLAKVSAVVDQKWQDVGKEVAGQDGFDAVRLQGAQWAHPPFPVFMTALGMMPALSNGAKVNLWGSADPIAMVVFNINHSQTRKSRLCGLAESAASKVDQVVGQRLAQMFEAKMEVYQSMAVKRKKKEREEDDNEVFAFPGTHSLAFMGGTIEQAKAKVAGDCPTVKQYKLVQKLPGMSPEAIDRSFGHADLAERAMLAQPGMLGRIWFGQPLIYDEAYGFLQDLSLLDKPGEKRTSESNASGQTPLAGWFNRLLQCGKSDHETKSNGSHGGLGCPSVSTSIVGNFHPTQAIEMLRGERGDHGCQSKARLLFCTGTPVQPHEAFLKEDGSTLSSSLEWYRIPDGCRDFIGLGGDVLESPRAFMAAFGEAFDDFGDDVDGSEAVQELPKHVPSEQGYDHELPDGVVTRVRLAMEGGRYVAQWALANRRVEIPEAKRIQDRFMNLVKASETLPHRELQLEPDAVGEFLGLCAMYNIKVKCSRDKCDADGAAEFGTSPWKLGMLSASLVLWDLMWSSLPFPVADSFWLVKRTHVQRAYKLMEILDSMRQAFQGSCGAEVAPPLAIEPSSHHSERVGEDRDVPGVTSVRGLLGTKFVRRILCRAAQQEDGDYISYAYDAFKIFSAKERSGFGKIGVNQFREVARACPPTLGKYVEAKDALIFQLSSGDENLSIALRGFANTTVEYLRSELTKRAALKCASQR